MMRTLAAAALLLVSAQWACAQEPPRALPAPPRPAPAAADPWGRQDLSTLVFPLKHVPATEAAAIVGRQLAEAHGFAPDHRGVMFDAPVVIVPDKAANSLVVVTQSKYLNEVHELVGQADREPRHVEVDLQIYTTGKDGERKCVSRPRLRCLTGQTAMLEIQNSDGCGIEIQLNVHDLEQAGLLRPVAATEPQPVAKPRKTIRQPACATEGEGRCTDEDLRVTKRLGEPISLHCVERPLAHVAREIATAADMNIVIDNLGLEECGATTDSLVTVNVEKITLATALEIILEPLGLDYTVKDEVLKITSPQRTRGPMTVATYPVADLVVPDSEPHHFPQKRVAALCELIRTTVQPDSWREAGGEGTLVPYERTLSLVIRQTRSGHEATADLLDLLRRVTQPAHETETEEELLGIPFP